MAQGRKKNIYGAAKKKWSSFAVHSPTDIRHEASHPMLHDRACNSNCAVLLRLTVTI